MVGDGHRLGQRGDVGREAVGHGQHERLLGDQLLGVGPGRVSGEADRVDPLRAADERQSHDRRPRGHCARASRAVLGHLAGELVAEHDRLGRPAEARVPRLLGQVGPGVESVAGVQVGAADAAARHRQTDLPAPRGRLGPLDDVELGVLAHDGLHRVQLAALARAGSRSAAVKR